ncbi:MULTISPECIES: glucosaminidase domain-containing protein [Salegentibacter]|jgi:flagellum-specific peptidoglycan hydrolase FlgJ|uniref:Peptidoglycan hydrolase n=1 Tax=Salegentibacter agarivorans TaxID=345907 RepID=A0A1I2L6K1_9FLAO|nr:MULTISPECIES: glucosaminidase domain-containing protein [Salegentibacter]APS38745.1 N-acetylmuramidase [Salegentibacter sp. T436]MBO2544217.1 glucosaminidase domain-containing protein [Salegentibacter sp. BDJ18]SFF74952.1 Flagellum-specific peptidoglycan hydrolase FlgJ [Salegentibacter agarivorans]
MRINRFFVLIFLAAFAVSCGSKKKVVTTKKDSNRENTFTESSNTAIERVKPLDGEPMLPPVNPRLYTVEDYIRDFAAVAMEEMRLYNIPASITLAQGILESGGGKGDLTMRANNHFGIKCHDWKGARAYHDDDARGECFRKYKDARYSYRDHSLFLTERKRYAELFELDEDDYKGWARGLRKAGYATDRRYPDKLISLIERYRLYQFDADVLKRPSPSYTYTPESPESVTYKVKKGDTLYRIAKQHNTTVEELQRFNNLRDTNISVGQMLVIISVE